MRVMNRMASLVAALLAGTAATAVAQQPGALKIAYVNTAALVEAAPGRAAAESTYQRETAAYSDELRKMNDSLQVLVAAYQRAEPTLTAAQKETRTRSIRAFQEQFQGRQQELQQTASQREQELMGPIMEQVKSVLDDIRSEGGYAMILAAEPSVILAADRNLDITERVVARLRSMPAPRPGAPGAAPAAAPQTPANPPTARPGAPVSAPAGATRQRPPSQ